MTAKRYKEFKAVVEGAGLDRSKPRDGFEKVIEGVKAIHKRIPPKAWSYNSGVETVHSTIEDEFFDLENFENIKDFHQ